MASGLNGFLYTGITSNLFEEVSNHKCSKLTDYSGWRCTHKLVYFEGPGSHEDAAAREKELNKMKRYYKVSLIEAENKEWDDLFYNLDNHIKVT